MAVSPIHRVTQDPLLRKSGFPHPQAATSPPFDRHSPHEAIHRSRLSRASLPLRDASGISVQYASLPRPNASVEYPKPVTHSPAFMSAVNSPSDRISAPQDNDTNGDLSDPEREEERARYRSWRQGRPALAGAFANQARRSKSGDASRVDKKIEAILPRPDPVVAARSRKASQYLRYFKENEAEEDQKRKERVRRQSKGQQGYLEAEALSTRKVSSSEFRHDIPMRRVPSEQIWPARSASEETQQPQSLVKDFVENLLGPYDQQEPVGLDSDRSAAEQEITALIRDEGRTLPSQLLHDVRQHHLDPRTAKSIIDSVAQDRRRSEDETESDREHISSAAYFPHKQITDDGPSPPAEDLERGEQAIPGSKRPSFSDHTRQERRARTPEEVEISLRDEDQEVFLHSELQSGLASAAASDDKLSRRFSTASSLGFSPSESENNSEDDLERATQGYESSANEDLGTTPTGGARRRESASHHRPRHEHSVASPRPAVTLKPYRHQVGGHNTVYHFSRKAIAKQLASRENEFYETVERHHPELLDFLPR